MSETSASRDQQRGSDGQLAQTAPDQRDLPALAAQAVWGGAPGSPAAAAQPPSVRRNPYVVGGWVRGANFYGRTKLIGEILDDYDRTIWLGGNRRIGKTSTLRRLEELGNDAGRVAFYIDLQGAADTATLTEYFLEEDNEERLARLGLTSAGLRGKAPHEVMRRLDRSGRERNLKVLLLLDEAEALIEIATAEGDQILKDLQREMQRSDALRVVLSATRRLMVLDVICRSWNTSKFLDGVTPSYLGALTPDETLTLIRQSQAPSAQLIEDGVARAIAAASNGHPFLTQWLCDRLWSEQGLRAPTPEDLLLDNDADLVTRMFQEDYNYLAASERSILKALAAVDALDAAGLVELIGKSVKTEQIGSLMSPLAQLCFVRRTDAGYVIGNELLRNWFRYCSIDEPAPAVSDDIAMDWADEKVQEIDNLIETHERRLRVREDQQAQLGITTPPEIVTEIEDIKKQIADLQRQRAQVRASR